MSTSSVHCSRRRGSSRAPGRRHRDGSFDAISPGIIATDFARPITDDPAAAPARLAKTPLGRFGTTAEVAGAVVWLASPAGAFVTGQNIVIDGGTLISD